MLVLDTSVVIAFATAEPEAPAFKARVQAASAIFLSACSYVEASLVLQGRAGAPGRSTFDALVGALETERLVIVAFDRQQAELAREGFRRYGKGRHPAGLNLGDCFAYALAKALDAPLLFKAGGFAKTDVARA